MAVKVHERLSLQPRHLPARRMRAEILAQGVRLASEALGIFIIGKHAGQLVAKYRTATGLERDDRRPRPDLVAKPFQHLVQQPARESQHPVVIERASTA